MKKNILLYLLLMAFPITFFSACGDDDDPEPTPTPDPDPIETTWKDGAGTFQSNLTLSLNEATVSAGETKSVVVAEGTSNAKITLKNIVPEAAEVTFDNVTMTKSGTNYTFTAEQLAGTTNIAVSGTLSGIPETKADAATTALDVKVTRTVTSPLAGSWNLNFMPAGENVYYGDVYFNVVSGNDSIDMVYAQLGPTLGGMMAAKVSAVTIKLPAAGVFDVSWIKRGETEATGMPAGVADIVKVYYFATNEQLFLAVDKGTMDLLGPVLPGVIGITTEQFNQLMSLFVVIGDFYALPVNFVINEDGVASFYTTKETLNAIYPLVAGMLGSSLEGMLAGLPAEQAAFLGQLLASLPTVLASADTFNVGLNFVPAE